MFELISLFTSMLVYVVYISIVCFKYGVPDCISKTYYLTKGNIFTYWIIAIALLLFPAWVSITSATYQFITFLSVVSLCGVGLAPRYLSDQRTQHMVFALIAIALSIIWSIVACVYIPLLIAFCASIALSLIFPSYKLFIVESLAFINIYVSVLVKVIVLI